MVTYLEEVYIDLYNTQHMIVLISQYKVWYDLYYLIILYHVSKRNVVLVPQVATRLDKQIQNEK